MLSTKQIKMYHQERKQTVYVNKFEVKHYMKQGWICYVNDSIRANPTDTGAHVRLPSFRLKRAYTNGATPLTILFLIAAFFMRPIEGLIDLLSKGFGFKGLENRNFYLQIGDTGREIVRQISLGAFGLLSLFPILWVGGYGVVLFITR